MTLIEILIYAFVGFFFGYGLASFAGYLYLRCYDKNDYWDFK